MTRKDYVAMAQVIREEVDNFDSIPEAMTAIHNITEGMAKVFKQDNERFDYERFISACGLYGL